MSSKVCMTLTSSTGEWLNGSLQPQHFYVSMEIKDPDGVMVARVALTFEQAARMLLYNGEVDCTLVRYRDATGKPTAEVVTPPETIHERMLNRLGKTHTDLLKRVEDMQKDLEELYDGTVKPGKKNLGTLLRDIRIIREHMDSNQPFVVEQAEEELGAMQSNAVEQLGTFLQTKMGGELPPAELLKQLLPVSEGAASARGGESLACCGELSA